MSFEASAIAVPERAAARSGERERTATFVALGLITALAIVLRFALFAKVQANPFYDAAVRSMGQSWHNFFFGAYEPGGQVAIDKTPVDLWLQVASTKLFGFSSTALRLPEAIAGTLAVPLLFDTVRRIFGRPAGLASAAVLAVLPVAVLTARSDTMDSVMMALSVAALWMLIRFVEGQRLRWLLVAAAGLVARASQTRRALPLIPAGGVLGLAFNVKLFEALIAVPALVALALLAGELPLRRRLAQLAGAGVAFAGVGLSWVTAASLLPGRHPWPIGSTNGGVWNVLFVFNGVDRVQVRPTPALAALDPAGPARLFSLHGAQHGLLIGSTLIAALLVGVAALAEATPRLLARRATLRGRLQRAGVVWIAVWLGAGVVLFSEMGRLHSRYLEAMTPAIAAAAGVGVTALASRSRRHALPALLLIVAAAVSAAIALHISAAPPAAVIIAVAGIAIAATGLAVRRSPRRLATAPALLAVGALVAVLAAPTAGAIHVVRQGSSNSGRPGAMPAATLGPLSRYLRAHQGGARYEVASSAVAKAGPLIARDGRPVLMLTSLYDRPLLTPAQLSSHVRRGDVRYVLLGSGTCSRRCPGVVRWAMTHARDVSRQAGLAHPGLLYRFTGAR